VLRANYHGSSGYGLDWVESICCGNYYSLEIPDLENGVDYLIDRGLVDANKLATMGWSNGAILSIELTTRNPRYVAASTGAGDVEWISDWANVDFGAAFDNYYFGAAPYEDPQRYIDLSPFFRMKDVQTPTIIYFGTEDRNVPTDQGWSHFRALQQIGQVPVKFILFPGEAHGIRKLAHQRRKLQEDLTWFDKYLFGTYEPENEAFNKESPLAEAFKRTEVAISDGHYGRLSQGTLVPEVVTYKGEEIGRFEVTRAQFAFFDAGYTYERGTGNYPANGVSFDEAQAYVEWLSQLTGEAYRLGTAAEMKSLYGSATGNENTLDYWAGYKPNPDDAALLAKKITELPGDAPLLREVGSFPGRGDDVLVFDLSGNVAEWVIGADGGGTLLGGSADLPADGKSQRAMAGDAYRGFRVVRGEEN
jgi:dienelactone hydrolase